MLSCHLALFYSNLFFVFQLSPWDPESRELRAECYIRLGDPRKAIMDLTPATRLRADNRAAFLKLSQLHYSLGEHHDSLRYVFIMNDRQPHSLVIKSYRQYSSISCKLFQGWFYSHTFIKYSCQSHTLTVCACCYTVVIIYQSCVKLKGK